MLREEVEVCPHCMGENILQHDVERNGYQVTCQHCGKKIMLCDACMHANDNPNRVCDWTESANCFRKPYHSKEKEFVLDQKHIDLIRNLIFEPNRNMAYETPFIPTINEKRPFGNSDIMKDAEDILQLSDPETIRIWLAELPTALRIIMRYQTFKPGCYTMETREQIQLTQERNYAQLYPEIKELWDFYTTNFDGADVGLLLNTINTLAMFITTENPKKGLIQKLKAVAKHTKDPKFIEHAIKKLSNK